MIGASSHDGDRLEGRQRQTRPSFAKECSAPRPRDSGRRPDGLAGARSLGEPGRVRGMTESPTPGRRSTFGPPPRLAPPAWSAGRSPQHREGRYGERRPGFTFCCTSFTFRSSCQTSRRSTRLDRDDELLGGRQALSEQTGREDNPSGRMCRDPPGSGPEPVGVASHVRMADELDSARPGVDRRRNTAWRPSRRLSRSLCSIRPRRKDVRTTVTVPSSLGGGPLPVEAFPCGSRSRTWT
jgi:hypothetical protein